MKRLAQISIFGIATVLSASVASSQQAIPPVGTEARTRAIVASFNKSKHVVKERRGVRREKYKDVRSEPVIRPNLQSFSGTYEAQDFGFALYLSVAADGRVQGSGTEQIMDGVLRRFELVDVRLKGPLLTGTRKYADGGLEKFEGVFINRTSYNSPDDKGFTEFGLGVVGHPIVISGVTVEKIFYRLKR